MYDETNAYTTYVFFNRYFIHTTVTKDPIAAASWIWETESIYHQQQQQQQQLVVGLDTEWRPSYQRGIENRVAILQLCVGYRCLIFQIMHSYFVPTTLINFLSNPSYTFAGVGIHGDFEKLARHYGITGGANVVELGGLAAQVYGDDGLKTAALKRLAMGVLSLGAEEVEKPEHVRRGPWDTAWLSREQVEYACIDGFLCYEIARVLISMGGVV